ncbi:MAG: hypothetical protein HY556_05950 [Euryarchaeota archaeon]|nr:hypothetical protein [Euryarchaeota archaeon]
MASPKSVGAPAPRYSVSFHPAAEREYLALPENSRRRFEKGIDALAEDPFRPRAGVDVVKLTDLGQGSSLHRLRVGKHRSCYAVIRGDRKVWILLFDDRGTGYPRMIRAAKARFVRRG